MALSFGDQAKVDSQLGKALGRISGPLLADNLKRNGADLAFETNLLYLNVADRYLGINHPGAKPTTELDISGNTLTTNLLVDTQADLGGTFEINTNSITNFGGQITISPNQVNPVIYTGGASTDNLQFLNNVLSSTTADTDIVLTPTGSYTNFNSVGLVTPNDTRLAGTAGDGFIRVTKDSWEYSNLSVGAIINSDNVYQASVQHPLIKTYSDLYFTQNTTVTSISPLQNDFGIDYYIVYISSILLRNSSPGQIFVGSYANQNVLINGDLHATGDITWDGNIALGNSSNDLIDFFGEIDSGIVPNLDATWNLGNQNLYFGTTYVKNYNSTSLQGKNLNPVQSINWATTTGLTISGTTISVPNAGMNITSQHGTGTLNFTTDMVVNGGFETGDFSSWTQTGNLNSTYIQKAVGGFDVTFTGGGSGRFGYGPYIGTYLTNVAYVDSYTIQYDATISPLSSGTSLTFLTYGNPYTGTFTVNGVTPVNGQVYYIGNTTTTTAQLFATYYDSVNNTNPLIVSPVDFTTTGLTFSTDSALNVTASVYQTYDAYPKTVLTTYPITTADKAMFSFTIDNIAPVSLGVNDIVYVGIGTHQTNLETYLGVNGRTGGNVSSYAFRSDGYDTNGNATPTFTTGDVVDVAVDRINGKIWLRVNNGFWNNDAAQNPTLTIGGLDISYLAVVTGVTAPIITGNIVYPGVSIKYVGGDIFFGGEADQVSINTITPYSLPGNFVLAHTYPSAARGGAYFEVAGPYATPGGIQQTVQTLPGVTYTIGWWVKVQGAYIRSGDAAPTVSISFNGVVLDTITNDIALDYQQRTYSVTATGYSAVLSIQYRDDPSYFYIDDISCIVNTPYFVGNQIRNIASGTLTLQSTGRGYTSFNTTTGAVLPVGTNSNYPTVVQTGLTRYNSTLGYAEVYNGTAWQMIADATGYATQDEIQNIINVWSIILG
jgi:hypothetical protein